MLDYAKDIIAFTQLINKQSVSAFLVLLPIYADGFKLIKNRPIQFGSRYISVHHKFKPRNTLTDINVKLACTVSHFEYSVCQMHKHLHIKKSP